MANVSKITLPSGITYDVKDSVSGYTKNTGTVTSVAVSAGTGISVSGSPVTTSGNITVGHSNSVTAQTTQAVYPIKIDAQGHISGYGSAVTIPSAYSLPLAASGTRGGVQIGYSESGTNYAVKLSSEKMYVTVPWTDTKLAIDEVSSTGSISYYPIVGRGSTGDSNASTRQWDSDSFIYYSKPGTTSEDGIARLVLGNTKSSGTANNKQGQLMLYGLNGYTHTISGTPTNTRTLTLPDKTGTIALTSDIVTYSAMTTTEIDTAIAAAT